MWAVLPIGGDDDGFILGDRGWLLIEEGIEFGMEIRLQDGKGHGVGRTVVLDGWGLSTFWMHVDVVGGGGGLGWWRVGA